MVRHVLLLANGDVAVFGVEIKLHVVYLRLFLKAVLELVQRHRLARRLGTP